VTLQSWSTVTPLSACNQLQTSVVPLHRRCCCSHRWHQQHQRHKGTAAAADNNPVYSDFEDIDPVNPTPPRIALLLRSEEGAVRSAQANLAAAITRHLSRPHVLTLTYGTHQGKGDTLLAFDSLGVPLQAYFLSTSVFRDAFAAI
jgi:hypothetical protein